MDNFLHRHDVLNLNIRTYCNLKEQYERIGERLAELNKSIKRDIIAEVHSVGDYIEGDIPTVPEWIKYHGAHGFTVHVNLKRSKRKPDAGALQQLLYEKGLLTQCSTMQVDEARVEEAFINGDLTDADMRSVVAEPAEPQLALKVERISDV